MTSDFGALTIDDYLDRLAEESRIPGAGPAAALTVAAAASLVAMAARFVREGWDEGKACAIQAETLRRRAVELARDDVEALEAFLAERDRPPDDRAEARDFKLGRTLERAADVPLAIVAAACDVALLAAHVADHAEHDVRADVVGAGFLASGAARAAAHLVEINLAAGADDPRLRDADNLARAAEDAAARVAAAV
jgi:formiminotetrahydrofolate cyclodeaminase